MWNAAFSAPLTKFVWSWQGWCRKGHWHLFLCCSLQVGQCQFWWVHLSNSELGNARVNSGKAKPEQGRVGLLLGTAGWMHCCVTAPVLRAQQGKQGCSTAKSLAVWHQGLSVALWLPKANNQIQGKGVTIEQAIKHSIAETVRVLDKEIGLQFTVL